jgi:hypothetical protein
MDYFVFLKYKKTPNVGEMLSKVHKNITLSLTDEDADTVDKIKSGDFVYKGVTNIACIPPNCYNQYYAPLNLSSNNNDNNSKNGKMEKVKLNVEQAKMLLQFKGTTDITINDLIGGMRESVTVTVSPENEPIINAIQSGMQLPQLKATFQGKLRVNNLSNSRVVTTPDGVELDLDWTLDDYYKTEDGYVKLLTLKRYYPDRFKEIWDEWGKDTEHEGGGHYAEPSKQKIDPSPTKVIPDKSDSLSTKDWTWDDYQTKDRSGKRLEALKKNNPTKYQDLFDKKFKGKRDANAIYNDLAGKDFHTIDREGKLNDLKAFPSLYEQKFREAFTK